METAGKLTHFCCFCSLLQSEQHINMIQTGVASTIGGYLKPLFYAGGASLNLPKLQESCPPAHVSIDWFKSKVQETMVCACFDVFCMSSVFFQFSTNLVSGWNFPFSPMSHGVASAYSDGTVFWSRPGILDTMCKFLGDSSVD